MTKGFINIKRSVTYNMDNATVTLLLGIAGILGTLFSGIKAYNIATKDRRNTYQERLFIEQLDILKYVHITIGRIKSTVPLLMNSAYEGLAQAETEAKKTTSELIEITHLSGAVLPSELWVELNRFTNFVCEYLDKNISDRSQEDINSIAAQAGTLAMASRKLLGVDEMSMETLKLIPKTKNIEIITAQQRSELTDIAKRVLHRDE